MNKLLSLENALDFDEDDLAANRDGYLSKRQREWIHRKGLGTVRWVFLLLLLFNGCFVARLLELHLSGVTDIATWLISIGAFAAMLYLSLRIPARLRGNIHADLHKGHVSVAEGRVQLHKIPYGINIDGRRFHLRDDRPLRAFRAGEHYRVYYTPHSESVLSAEPIFDEDAAEG